MRFLIAFFLILLWPKDNINMMAFALFLCLTKLYDCLDEILTEIKK